MDSSYEIGSGHVMRCLTLAKAINERIDANIYFFARNAQGNINDIIKSSGFNLIEMQAPNKVSDSYLFHASWLGAKQKDDADEFLALSGKTGVGVFDLVIIDHYAINYKWQNQVRSISKKIMVIDDLGDRDHICDYLLDQTFRCMTQKYESHVPKDCELMLGTNYALMRKEFHLNRHDIKAYRKERDENIVLVMFGGTDPDNLTLKTLELVCNRSDISRVNIIIGEGALHLNSVKEFCEKKSECFIHISPNNIAEIMLDSTLAIGAAGTTSWERCALGLPAVVVIQADNQRQIARELEMAGAINCLEPKELESSLNARIDYWFYTGVLQEDITRKCLNICDAQGSQRVIEKVFGNV